MLLPSRSELAERALAARLALGNERAERDWYAEHFDELPRAQRNAACRRFGWDSDALPHGAAVNRDRARARARGRARAA